ncbi:MAG: hypothetical protein N2444_00510 [Methylocystis sp.]|nr:hypothetical protein [Methylocystis sp.]
MTDNEKILALLSEMRAAQTYRDVDRRIRADLLRFADAFIAETKIAESRIGRDALNNSAYLLKVRRGIVQRIAPEKYDRLLAYFERHLNARLAKNAKAALPECNGLEAEMSMLEESNIEKEQENDIGESDNA